MLRAVVRRAARKVDNQAADGRAGHRGDLEDRAVPGDGIGEDLGRHNLRQNRRPGGSAQGVGRRADGKQDVNRSHRQLPPGGRGQPRRDGRAQRERNQHHAAAIETIGDLASGDRQQHDGKRLA